MGRKSVLHSISDVIDAEKSYGMKLMKTMGWKEGEGLGKDGDGQQTHIQIKLRTENEGIRIDSLNCYS